MRFDPRALLIVATGCALVPYPVDECATNADCGAAFGVGSTCDPTDGLCYPPDPHPRCEETFPDDLYGSLDHRVLGTVFDLQTDGPNLRSIRLAVRQIDDAGGVGGRDVGLIYCTVEDAPGIDDLGREEAAAETTLWLAETIGVPAILGPGSSGQSLAAFEALATAGHDVLLLAPSATSPALTTIDGETSTDDDPGLFWRTAPPDSGQAVVIAADIDDRLVDDIGIIHQDSAYGTALAELVEEIHTADGDRATLFSFDDVDSRAVAIATAGADATLQEVVFISSEPQDIVSFLNSASVIGGYDGKTFFLTDSGKDPYILENTNSSGRTLFPRIRGSAPTTPEGILFTTFQAAYAAEYDGEDASLDSWNSYSYDAGWLGLYALEWAVQQEPAVAGTAMARGLRRVANTLDGVIIEVGTEDLGELRDEFGAGRAVNVEGASGSLDFDPVTGETANPIDIFVIGADGTSFEVVRICQPDGTCEDA